MHVSQPHYLRDDATVRFRSDKTTTMNAHVSHSARLAEQEYSVKSWVGLGNMRT